LVGVGLRLRRRFIQEAVIPPDTVAAVWGVGLFLSPIWIGLLALIGALPFTA
jgi:hypothetical protein